VWGGTRGWRRELRHGRERALGPRALARRRAFGLLDLEHRSPTEVAALGALGRLEVLEAVAPRQAARAALETFDYERVHVRSIGAAYARWYPCLGERKDGRAPR
jgi:hypothetical protein